MTIKEVIEESKDVLQKIKVETDKEQAVTKLHKLLGVLAVKAEMVNDFDTTEIVSKIEKCRELLKEGAFDDTEKVLVFVKILSEIQNYKWEEDEWDKLVRESAEDDKRFALEDVQKAYDNYLSIRKSYMEKYGEYPDIEE